MKFQFFTIPVQDNGSATHALNSFCSQKRITQVEKHFIADGQNSYWSICLTWVDGSEPPGSNGKNRKTTQVDYKEVLNGADFAIYSRLRELRKQLAEADGVPPYHVLTNEQLARMVTDRIATRTDFRHIEGIGDKRTEKYADAFLELLKHMFNQSGSVP
ncbi:MAG: HRDC domain-containing protein [Gammaproteobacteria bacterium]|nr:HRDC domain-containing protein [Gammaproteobacteria bacterium]